MKFENTEVWGFEHSIRGMRNPLESWNKSDSEWKYKCNTLGPSEEPHYCNQCGYDTCNPYNGDAEFVLGENDLNLMQRLIKAGSPDRKFMRQIFVSVDITAPSFWVSELDTYKIGTVRNSCSLQHKGASRPFTIRDFEVDDERIYGAFESNDFEWLCRTENNKEFYEQYLVWETILDTLNKYRELYNKTKDYKYFRIMRQLMPMGYLYKFTWTANYEVIRNMISQRIHHRLAEWKGFDDESYNESFISWARTLPYAEELLFYNIDKKDNNK